jgi:hypothetical protein
VSDVAYNLGQVKALEALGLKEALFGGNSPFPHKSPSIGAERLARILQQQDDQPEKPTADNKGGGRPRHDVSWGPSINLSGLDAGEAPPNNLMLPNSFG